MKARIKKTGEIVDVYFEGQNGSPKTDIFKESVLVNARMFRGDELEILNPTQLNEDKHWQNIKERTAIAAMQAILTHKGIRYAKGEIEDNVGVAVEYANELVKQLKGISYAKEDQKRMD